MPKAFITAPGGWGIALAALCRRNNIDTVIWGKFPDEIKSLCETRESPLLKGIHITDEIDLTCDMNKASDADIIIMATPSFAVRETSAALKNIVSDKAIIVSVAKGFDKESHKRFSQIISEELPDNPVVVLSGPSHAEEVAREIPTSVTVASTNAAAAEKVQEMLMCSSFRIYTNSDVVGVEVGAALKNIVAMAAGICDGLGLGDNTIAALMTRGIHEISRLGVKMGAKWETFAGLSGIGDLIVTCTSKHSRNRRFGKAIGEGMSVDEALKFVGMTVESYYATAAAKQLADEYGVEMPIVSECYDILYCNGVPREKINSLMNRPMKSETLK